MSALTEHTQLWTRIYGATMFLPKPLKKISILVEKIPWVAAQHVRAASHVPAGTDGTLDLTPSSPGRHEAP